MKKIVAGGFLSLVGSIWALAILVSASNSLVNEWVTETGRLMSTVIEMKMMFPLILCVICIAFGIIMMLVESFMEQQKAKYTCPKCGGIISIHDRECSECQGRMK